MPRCVSAGNVLNLRKSIPAIIQTAIKIKFVIRRQISGVLSESSKIIYRLPGLSLVSFIVISLLILVSYAAAVKLALIK